MSVPVHILSGFLGSGKTTALLDLLQQRPNERAAVIVNDFGEASLDASRFSDEAGVQIADIPGSCVCCTAPEGFGGALTKLLEEVKPDRIFVEPTGLARPADLVDTLRRGPWRDQIAIGPVLVLVDPRAVAGPFVREQAEAADVLVANRIDLCSEEELQGFRAWGDALWPGPFRRIETSFGKLDPTVLDWGDGEGPRRRFSAVGGAHETGHIARSWSWPPSVTFSRERLADALARMVTGRTGAKLARLKGVLRTEEGSFRVEVAGGVVDENPSAFRRDSRVDVILEGDDSAALETAAAWLEAAILTDAELQVDGSQVEFVRPDGTRATFDRASLSALPGGLDVSTVIPTRSGQASRLKAVFEALELPMQGEVVVVASDGYATPAVPAEALDEGVLLHSLGDAPLPDGKGGPFRLLIPGDAGPAGACSNVKGVVRVIVRA